MSDTQMPVRIWLILATATMARIGSGMQTQSVAAVGPSIVADLGLAYVALGTLVGAYSLPGIAAALPGGWLIARIGDRRIVLASLAVMAIGGGLMAIAENYQILLAGRVLSGAGSGMLSVAIPKIVFDQVPPERLTGIMGGVIAGFPLGFASALLFLPLLDSWRLAMGFCAVVCTVSFVAASATITHSVGSRATSAGRLRLASGTAGPLLLISLVWALYNGGCVILFSFVPAFFVAHGLSLAQAGAMTGLSLYTTIPITPFGGWLLARSVGVMPGIILSLVGMAILPVLMLTSIPPTALMIAFGALVGISSGPVFALAGQGLRPDERALAMGILMTILNVTMTAAPPLAGFARDLSGSPAAPFYVATAVLAAALLVQIVHCVWRRTASVIAA